MTDNSEDALTKDFEQLKKISAACLKNAEDLIKSAKLLIDENVDHICFHLAALALEEVGKITMLRTKFGARVAGRSETFSTPVIDDHIKKLFWAFWGPMFTQGNITKEQLDQWKGVAQNIHNRRLQSLYVDPNNALSSEEKVTHEEAVRLVNLAEARVGMQAEEGEQELDESTTELLSWFMDASDNPDQRAYMFGKESMDRLAELKSPRKWIEWLNEQAMTYEAESRKLMERELSRPAPSGDEANEKRWKIKIRLYSASHSIRKKALTKWNDMSSHIFLYSTNRHDELVCEFNLVKRLSVNDLWPGLWEVSRLFVLSLNVATQGFFWWYLPREIDSLYDEVIDLENDRRTRIQDTEKFRDCWHHLVLAEEHVMVIRSVMVYIMRVTGSQQEQPFVRYALGLSLLAKSDPQLKFHINAFIEFFAALKTALYVNEQWDGNEDLEPAAQRAFAGDEELEGLNDAIQLGIDVEQGKRLDEVTSKRVVEMKVFCDVFFLGRTTKELKGVDLTDIVKQAAIA